MQTLFATPQRSSQSELNFQIDTAANHPVVNGIMHMVGGLIAVLNANRQIVAANHRLLKMLGVDDPENVLGLRPGEALNCVHANELEAGCGTSGACGSCGAAIAIVSALGANGPVERSCVVATRKNGKRVDFVFHVHANAIRIDAETYVLIFLKDITRQQSQAALARVFFHDINNTIMGLLNAGELLSAASIEAYPEMPGHIVSLANRLAREVELQRHLVDNDTVAKPRLLEKLSVDFILKELQAGVAHHPARKEAVLKIDNRAPGTAVRTDLPMLLRVLTNMLINAFEADNRTADVEVQVRCHQKRLEFRITNSAVIEAAIARRIFQRNFSTKQAFGRGLGTYSMKLIGEQLLGGRVSFESSPATGTCFFFSLPLPAAPSKSAHAVSG